jgi:hypothetical protein
VLEYRRGYRISLALLLIFDVGSFRWTRFFVQNAKSDFDRISSVFYLNYLLEKCRILRK